MDLAALAAEFTAGHPVTGAYNVDAKLAAAEINALNISVIKESMSGSEMLALTDATEFGGLTDSKKSEWLSFCGVDSHSPVNNGVAHKFVEYIFGGTSTTETNLAAGRNENVSRSSQLGFGTVKEVDVLAARAL